MPISHRVWLQDSPATPQGGRSLLYREDSANKQRPPSIRRQTHTFHAPYQMSRTFVTFGLLFQCLSEDVCTLGRANHHRQTRSCVCRSKHRYAELWARSNRAGAVGSFGMVSSDRQAC